LLIVGDILPGIEQRCRDLQQIREMATSRCQWERHGGTYDTPVIPLIRQTWDSYCGIYWGAYAGYEDLKVYLETDEKRWLDEAQTYFQGCLQSAQHCMLYADSAANLFNIDIEILRGKIEESRQ
jgi:hypothetical protein